MTLDEAIQHYEDVIKEKNDELTEAFSFDSKVAFDDDIEECVKYKEEHEQLKTWLEEYKVLKERATPKKIEKATREEYQESGYKHMCPTCGNCVGTITNELDIEHDDYCPTCGQALDWSDEE